MKRSSEGLSPFPSLGLTRLPLTTKPRDGTSQNSPVKSGIFGASRMAESSGLTAPAICATQPRPSSHRAPACGGRTKCDQSVVNHTCRVSGTKGEREEPLHLCMLIEHLSNMTPVSVPRSTQDTNVSVL